LDRQQAGFEALRRGDAASARTAFREAVATAPAGRRPWLGLASACQRLGDTAGEQAALDALLSEDPRNLAGMLLKGKSCERAGDDRAAQSFYMASLRQAAVAPPAADLQPLLREAERFVRDAQARFENHLLQAVSAAPSGASGITRFERAIDLLLGRRELHVSQPSMFYFPGLPQIPFHDTAAFRWAAALEAATAVIRDEMRGLVEAFPPYVASDSSRPRPAGNSLLDDGNWGASHLFRNGLPTAVARQCPATLRALAEVPMPVIAGRSPMALFSRLRRNTHIQPHYGLLNTRLICHLPLVVPDHCGIRVGDETRHWREGELMIFDDSFEHEAWNRGSEDRTILLFEVWRPELDVEERRDLAALFAAIEQYGDAPVDQG